MILEQEVVRGELPLDGRGGFAAVLQPGWCYKFMAVGDSGLGEIDVRISDPQNVLLQRDVDRGPRAVLGQIRPICPTEAGVFQIEIRATEGSGSFAGQLLRSI